MNLYEAKQSQITDSLSSAIDTRVASVQQEVDNVEAMIDYLGTLEPKSNQLFQTAIFSRLQGDTDKNDFLSQLNEIDPLA